MKVLLILLMFASIWGMVVGLKKHKEGAVWGRPLTLLCLLLAFPIMIVQFRSTTPGGNSRALINREMAFREALGAKVGQIVADEFAGAHVVVIPDQATDSPVASAFTSALDRAASVELLIPDFESYFLSRVDETGLQGEEARMWMEEMIDFAVMDMGMSADLLNIALRQVDRQPDVLVFFSPLPYDFMHLEILQRAERPRIILASGHEMFEIEDLASGLERGLFHGVVTFNAKNWRAEGPVPSRVEEAFAERYVWVTSANQLLDALPHL